VSGAGHGIIGMRERANLCGGLFSAGPLPDGGWQVAATLPLLSLAENKGGAESTGAAENKGAAESRGEAESRGVAESVAVAAHQGAAAAGRAVPGTGATDDADAWPGAFAADGRAR
jgi:hypothetical protein